jgi:hypothetical protein
VLLFGGFEPVEESFAGYLFATQLYDSTTNTFALWPTLGDVAIHIMVFNEAVLNSGSVLVTFNYNGATPLPTLIWGSNNSRRSADERRRVVQRWKPDSWRRSIISNGRTPTICDMRCSLACRRIPHLVPLIEHRVRRAQTSAFNEKTKAFIGPFDGVTFSCELRSHRMRQQEKRDSGNADWTRL